MTISNGSNYSLFLYVICSNLNYCRSAASATLCAIYGWDPIEPEDDPLVERVNALTHRVVRAALPGAYLVEVFPIMKYLPSWMAKWKREGLEWFMKDSRLFEGFLADVEERMVRFSIDLLVVGLAEAPRLA